MSDNNNHNNVALLINDDKTDGVICENCHAKVTGSFCSQCGQSIESTLRYFWSVILHLLDDIFSFDSRASRTIFPLMFKPGFLTNEYFAGRRVHYVPPLRLYLFISIIFFLALSYLAGDNIFTGKDNIESNQKITHYLQQLEEKKSTALIDNEKSVIENIEQEIVKYQTYQEALNNKSNMPAADVTDTIVLLEFKKIRNKGELSVDDTEKLANAIERLKLLNVTELPEKPKKKDKKITFSNNADGTFTFDFLSKDNNIKLNEFTEELERKAEKAFSSDPTPLYKESISKLPQLMFIVLPIFAALLKIMYMFSNRLYMEHLTVALHSHSFIFLTIFLVEVADWLYDKLDESSTLLRSIIEYSSYAALIWLPIYLIIMQKRVYNQGKFLTFIKYNVIAILYIILLSFTAFIAFIWGLTDTQL